MGVPQIRGKQDRQALDCTLPQGWLSVADIAGALNVKDQTVYTWVHECGLLHKHEPRPAGAVGRYRQVTLIDREDLIDFLAVPERKPVGRRGRGSKWPIQTSFEKRVKEGRTRALSHADVEMDAAGVASHVQLPAVLNPPFKPTAFAVMMDERAAANRAREAKEAAAAQAAQNSTPTA